MQLSVFRCVCAPAVQWLVNRETAINTSTCINTVVHLLACADVRVNCLANACISLRL